MTGGELKIPLVIRTQGAEGYRQDLIIPNPWKPYTPYPGAEVVMPATPYDAKGLLKSSIRDDNPVIFIEHKGLYAPKGRYRKKSTWYHWERRISSARAQMPLWSAIHASCCASSK